VFVANDHGAPTVSLSSPAPGAIVGGTVSLVAAAADDIGVAGVKFLVDGVVAGAEVVSAPYQLSWNTTGMPNGPHTVNIVARDAAGHETVASAQVIVTNDHAAPILTLSSPGAGATVSGTVSLVAAAADDIGVAGVQLLVDGASTGIDLASAPYQWFWNSSVVGNGPHTLSAIARDAAGHETTASVEVIVANDQAAPIVTLFGPGSGAIVSGTTWFVATAADDIGVPDVAFMVDGVPASADVVSSSYEWSWNTAAVGDGSHTVSAVARDAAGHETIASVDVIVVNNIPPPPGVGEE
jgi:hypothetical protein